MYRLQGSEVGMRFEMVIKMVNIQIALTRNMESIITYKYNLFI